MDQARDKRDGIARSFERLAAAETRLAASALSAADRETLARLRSDIAAGLVLLLSRADGCISRTETAAAAAPLALALPANVIGRLPAAARLAALDLVALAEGASAGLVAAQAAEPQNEKPRRRQSRPRLELVSP
ncbi:hypothetical protein GGQ86_004437 [Xanthobacter flavus]|uniref:Uncharacterized protein n=1 Tax=Xanthobacter flavus TaxID=281 RepID=A0A9W6CV52_XANFL|nr:hypothetical protein [Xanthobacter flavus]MBN8914233.1 hypothetical protein [Hyphomicrobiales bacterium]MDR6335939.1 hypothetical protein [Xanthobacter flavus]GLI24428.1 hypothetical protein XFLAVUS301_41020 [Xanthobacter flavus]